MTRSTKCLVTLFALALAFALGTAMPIKIDPSPLSAQTADGFSLAAADGAPSDVVFVSNDGDVGIGTLVPDKKLHVVGSATITGKLTTGDGLDVTNVSSSVSAVYRAQDVPLDNGAGFRLGITDDMGINRGGVMTFMAPTTTGAGNDDLGAMKGAKENATNGDRSGYLAFATRSDPGGLTEEMRLTSGGNMGLGTTSPSEKLHVVGNIFLTGALTSSGDICIGSGCP